MVGKVLGNRYRIQERIGGGGMALVYRAEDLQLGRDVAVKVLRGQFGYDDDFVRRFRREATSAASLSHPNVVQIYDVGQDEEQYFIVMELVEGKTLKALIQEQGPVPIAEASRIAIQILGALSHAHQHRIVHRDIKPHNILIARDGRAKVTDFGIARATTTDTVTHTGSIMGSAHYFSPEQANGQPTGEKSDIYSMGIVLYEMVTGAVPFQGDSPITVALKHLRDRVVPPSQLNAEVPVELEQIILRALEKEPDDRYESADAMRSALEEFQAKHAAGETHMSTGDFPTMDLRDLRATKSRRARRIEIEEEEDEGDEEPRRSRTWVWVLSIALLFVGLAGAAVWGLINFLEVPTVQVPDVKGLALTKAQEKLRQSQLDFNVQSEQNNELPPLHVISTDPPPGTPVKLGRKVALVISKGPETIKLQDVQGKQVTEARAELESSRFVVEVTTRVAPEAEGTVIGQSPAPLTPLKPGDLVKLTVSAGPRRVPSLLGKSLQEAERLLAEAGLVVGARTYEPHPTEKKDVVLSANPSPGSPVVPGQAVNLVLAQGAAPGTAFTKEITLPGEPGKYYTFRVTVVDKVNNVPTETATNITGERKGGEKVTVSGTFYGEAYLSVIRDGSEVQQIKLP